MYIEIIILFLCERVFWKLRDTMYSESGVSSHCYSCISAENLVNNVTKKKISAKHLSVNKPQRISPTKDFTLLSLSRLWYQGTLKIYQEMKIEKVQTKATFHLLFEWRFKIFRKYAFMFCFMETVHDTGRPIIYRSLAFFWVKDWVLMNTNNILSLTTKPTPRKNRTSAELLTSSSISATRFKY